MKRKPLFNVAIVGAGNVGSVLGKLLLLGGQRIVCIVSRTDRSARNAGKFLGCRLVSTSLADIPSATNLVLIATPHNTIGAVAQSLAALRHLNYGRLAVCHTSGMLTADVLDPLRELGATVFSFHPLQTFPRDFPPRNIVGSVRGIYYGIDGQEKGVKLAAKLAKVLRGRAINIPPDMREFYHAACVVASNHLTTLLWVLERMYQKLGTSREKFYRVFEPIIEATLRNVASTSPANALSGPIARGGVETVSSHLISIKKHLPEIVPYYLRLTADTARLAKVKGSISDARYAALVKLVESFSNEKSHAEEIC